MPSIQVSLPYYIKIDEALVGVVKALLTGNISAYIASSIILAHTLWGAIKAIPPFINEVG